MKGINKIEFKKETVKLPTNMNMDYLRSVVISDINCSITPFSCFILI
jgi:hypothetical protein